MYKKIVMLCKKTDFCLYAIDLINSYFDKNEVLCVMSDGSEKLDHVLKNIEMDYLISYLSPWIIPPHYLNIAKKGAINFHPGSPAYPGTGCYNFALYEKSRQYGVTCHYMKEKVDTGEIIMTSYFNIAKNESVASLKLKSMSHMLIIFEKLLSCISTGAELPVSNETWIRPAFTRKQLTELCRLEPQTMSLEEMQLRIKATIYSDNIKFGPYIQIGSNKFYCDGE